MLAIGRRTRKATTAGCSVLIECITILSDRCVVMMRIGVLAFALALLPAAQQTVIRNPRQLRAMQLLTQRQSGVLPRVRFEWDAVAGAHGYLLSGRWANPLSWTLASGEYRVTRQVATRWDAQRVQFDVSLPEGHHSWRVVALFGTDDVGDFARPTTYSFELR